MSYQDIAAGTTERFFTVVRRSNGNPITSGLVNYYLLAKSGANVGRWWRDSDQSWQAGSVANAMTHQDDGHWEIDRSSSPIESGVRYLEYFKESGDLHIPDSRHLVGAAAAAVGTGAIKHPIDVTSDGIPIDGAEVWITTDAAGDNVVAGTLPTDAFGRVEFMLDAGSYYAWIQAAGHNFTNPTTFTVS